MGQRRSLYKKILDPDMTKLRAAIKNKLPSSINLNRDRVHTMAVHFENVEKCDR